MEDSQGGIGPAGLSSEDLHVLDLTQAKPRWHRLVINHMLAGTYMRVIRALYVGSLYLP